MILLALLLTYFPIPRFGSSIAGVKFFRTFLDPIKISNPSPHVPPKSYMDGPILHQNLLFLAFSSDSFSCAQNFLIKKNTFCCTIRRKILEHSIILGDGNTTGLTILDLERSSASVVD